MKVRKKFDLIHSTLASEITLVEASAGTGKTRTIAGLVLRLVLEQELGIEEILVTTYTELATAELRNRIRNLLLEMLAALQTGQTEDELVELLLRRYQPDEKAQRRLSIALQNFDSAPIYTIHGFAQRMLRDQAFESGALFDAELVTDQSDILHEITDDFWRRHFYLGEPIVATFAIKNELTPEKFFRHITELTKNPALQVVPEPEGKIERIKDECAAIWNQVRECWRRSQSQVRTIFEQNAWAKYTYAKPERMAFHLSQLEKCLSDDAGVPDQLDCLKWFAWSKIERSALKGYRAPKHELFTLCDRLLSSEKRLCLSLQIEFFAWARQELPRRKAKRNVLSFDDLLTRLDEALDARNGEVLARAIRDRFKAALVDEFQDTDPIQYSIFKKIYDGKKRPVFFVGDPKQAIYGFRGADVFTYITAAGDAPNQFTLGKNWRSTTELVRAVNTLFKVNQRPFILEGIPFAPVEAAGKSDRQVLTVDGRTEPPLKVWLTIEGEPIKREDALERLPQAVATEIADLLSKARIGSDQVQPWDIAILVSRNEEARIMQAALTGLKIPSVLYSAANVFKSAEAIQLEYILAAVSEPGNERFIKAALTTEILGLTGDDLDTLVLDDRAWDSRLMQFQKYHQLWSEKGFVQMLRTLLLEQGVRARLLSYPAGERRLTNLLHLSELLHTMCMEHQLGMAGTLKRLAEEIQSPDIARSEQFEQRLESDEKAVRIVTIHKSKGLEYPIVFCPFCWSDAEPWDRSVIFHQDEKLTLDLEESEEHRHAQRSELLAEKMRLLYVALTRAKHRCYLVWGDFKFGRKSAPAYLFGVPDGQEALEALERRSKSVTGPQVRTEVELALGHEKAIEIADLPILTASSYQPAPVKSLELRPREFHGAIARTAGISSFTGLIRGHDIAPETPDYDAAETPEDDGAQPEAKAPLTGIFAFPHGTRPGSCLHQIFQELDFCDLEKMPTIVGRNLRAFSIGGFDEAVCAMVRKTVSVPLEIDQPEFTLSRVAASGRLPEMEFYFPITALTPAKLSEVFLEHGEHFDRAIPSTIDRLQFRPWSGFMKGFIDLVFEFEDRFYLVDWKSNWLGPDLDAYSSDAIRTEMTQRFYTLQLSIYTVALHRFLHVRKPGYDYEKHFGGAYYLFLRGVEPARPEFGVHRMKPAAGFVEKLSSLFGS